MIIKCEYNAKTKNSRSIDCSIDFDAEKITFRVCNSKKGILYAEYDNFHAAKIAYSDGWND